MRSKIREQTIIQLLEDSKFGETIKERKLAEKEIVRRSKIL